MKKEISWDSETLRRTLRKLCSEGTSASAGSWPQGSFLIAPEHKNASNVLLCVYGKLHLRKRSVWNSNYLLKILTESLCPPSSGASIAPVAAATGGKAAPSPAWQSSKAPPVLPASNPLTGPPAHIAVGRWLPNHILKQSQCAAQSHFCRYTGNFETTWKWNLFLFSKAIDSWSETIWSARVTRISNMGAHQYTCNMKSKEAFVLTFTPTSGLHSKPRTWLLEKLRWGTCCPSLQRSSNAKGKQKGKTCHPDSPSSV